MGKKFITQVLMRDLTFVALSDEGYEVQEEYGYIIAKHPDSRTPDLIICSIARLLTKKTSSRDESKMFSASLKTVQKLKNMANTLAGDYIPCLSFGVAKYSYSDLEICIIPISEWNKNASRGGTLSITDGGYYYNYQKADQFLPETTITRRKWITI